MYEILSERRIPCYPFCDDSSSQELMSEDSELMPEEFAILVYVRRSRDPRKDRQKVPQENGGEKELALKLVTKLYKQPTTHYVILEFPKQKEEQTPAQYLEELVTRITRGEVVLKPDEKQFNVAIEVVRS